MSTTESQNKAKTVSESPKTGSKPKRGLRERKKLRTRKALAEAAWKLFRAKGFDETTVEEIAEAADVSPRTFFRYFESKEAVLLGTWQDDLETGFDFLTLRPPDEPPLETLRALSLALAENFENDKERILAIKRLAMASKSVGDFERTRVLPELEAAISGAIAARMGVDPATDYRPMLYSGITLAVFHAAKLCWLASDGERSLVDLVDRAWGEILS